jgi:hypothetical protein
MFVFITFIKDRVGSSSQSKLVKNKQIKGMQIGKKEVNLNNIKIYQGCRT